VSARPRAANSISTSAAAAPRSRARTPTARNFKVGIGGRGTLNDGGGKLKAANVTIGTENGGSGLVNVSGAGAAFSMTTFSVGSFQSGSSTTGGVGTLLVSSGGYVSVAKTLALNEYASADTNLKDTFSGGIYLSGGSIEIGGSKGGIAVNTLQIDSGGLLSGHGVIAGGNNFNVTISKGGKIEAKNGLLVISGNVNGSGTIQIDNGATVEIVGLELDKNLNLTFQSGGTGTLILDSPGAFTGTIAGLTNGDRIVLANTGSATTPTPNEVVAATIGSSSDLGQTLYVQEGYNIVNQTRQPISIAVNGPANDPILTGEATQKPHFFAVSSGGSGVSNSTTLTLSSGSPIAQVMGLNQSGGLGGQFLTGAGIKIGIISDSFNFNSATGKETPLLRGRRRLTSKMAFCQAQATSSTWLPARRSPLAVMTKAAPWQKSFMPSRPGRRSSSRRRAWNRRLGQTSWTRLDRPSKTCKPSMSRSHCR
jgi:hypothetical protein